MKTNTLKKTIAVALIAVVAATGLFATDVVVNGTVDAHTFVPTLHYYTNTAKTEKIDINDTTNIYKDNISEKWDLTEDGNTYKFYVSVAGNQKDAQTLTVTVDAANFTGTYDNGTKTANGPEVKVNDLSENGTYTVPAGYHTDSRFAEFYLSWIGDAELPATDYTSTVAISYSVN